MLTDLKRPSTNYSFLGGALLEAYEYDQLNRIKQQRTYHRKNGAWDRASGDRGLYDSDYAYDRNGNIEQLSRRMPDVSLASWDQTYLIDNLAYTYNLNVNGAKTDNRLLSAADSEPLHNGVLHDYQGTAFTYDAIGNIVTDVTEHIANIRWDLHGKVREVARGSNAGSRADLAFWYDGTGNRVHKRVTTPGAAGGPDVVRDEWYVRDPQGNEMAVYERYEDNGYLVTNLKEHAIYGSDRLGLDLNGVELSRLPIGEGGDEDPTGDPSGRHALVIGEIMYDSPTTGEDFPTGKEYSEGEYVVLINKSGITLNLSNYHLRLGEDSLALGDSLPTDSLLAGGRVIIGFGADNEQFQRITAMPEAFMGAVRLQSSFTLPDRGGVLSITHRAGSPQAPGTRHLIDALPYGEFYGLSAGNAYVADSLLDSLGQRSSLTSVQRRSYGGPSAAEGASAGGEVGIGANDPGVEPEPTENAVVDSCTLWRGRKVYELKNHLGNVLAVVSDVKLGQSNSSLVSYYTADVVEMSDYEPFGMLLSKRHWVSGEGYRFGFNGKEGDDEWNGEGNMVDFGARMNDPRLGRFLGVDPKWSENLSISPYAFAANLPTILIDHNGESPKLPPLWDSRRFRRAVFSVNKTVYDAFGTARNSSYSHLQKAIWFKWKKDEPGHTNPTNFGTIFGVTGEALVIDDINRVSRNELEKANLLGAGASLLPGVFIVQHQPDKYTDILVEYNPLPDMGVKFEYKLSLSSTDGTGTYWEEVPFKNQTTFLYEVKTIGRKSVYRDARLLRGLDQALTNPKLVSGRVVPILVVDLDTWKEAMEGHNRDELIDKANQLKTLGGGLFLRPGLNSEVRQTLSKIRGAVREQSSQPPPDYYEEKGQVIEHQ